MLDTFRGHGSLPALTEMRSLIGSEASLKKSTVEYLDFFIIDIAAIEISLLAVRFIHQQIGPTSSVALWNLSIMLPMFHWFLLLLMSPYKGVLQRGYIKEFVALLNYQVGDFCLITVFFYFLNVMSRPRRSLLLLYFIIVIPLTYVMRFVHKFHLKRRYNDLRHTRQILVVTTRDLAREMISEITSSVIRNYQFFGLAIIDCEMTGEKIDGVSVSADRESLIEYAKSNVVDEVFINFPDDTACVLKLAQQFLEMGITVHINMEESYQKLPNRSIGNMFGYDVLTTTVSPISIHHSILKRLMDIVGGLVGSIITVILTLIIGPIIFIKSPGPIFFTQYRVGKNGRLFKIYKFRSMYTDAEERKKELLAQNKVKDGMMFKMENDPRIIKGIGSFIRKTSIDEFPQFFNVLKGEMSMVGTRPPTLDEYIRYSPSHKKRLAMAPGITGLWQVSGRSNITDFDEVVKLDTQYIENWSLGGDIKILLKTVRLMAGGDGAM